jgi:hypothetical protein
MEGAIIAAAGGNPDAITTAVIALAGALIGALIAAAAQIVVYRLQTKRDAAAAQRTLRTAARVMYLELEACRTDVTDSAEKKQYKAPFRRESLLTAEDRRLVLGVSDDEQNLGMILAGLITLDEWNQVLQEHNEGDKLDRDLEAFIDSLDRALAPLAQLDPGRPVPVTKPFGALERSDHDLPATSSDERPDSQSDGFEDNG